MKPDHIVPLFGWNDRSRYHEHIQQASTRRRDNVDIMSHRFQEDVVTPRPSMAIAHMEGCKSYCLPDVQRGSSTETMLVQRHRAEPTLILALIRRCICAVLFI